MDVVHHYPVLRLSHLSKAGILAGSESGSFYQIPEIAIPLTVTFPITQGCIL
jgi:hypothetical protein